MGNWQKEEKWQKPYIEATLNQHNATYGTSFIMIGRCESVYQELEGKQRWDWVCRDSNKETEGAIEVKALTKELLEEQSHFLWHEIGQQLKNSLSGKLPGTFHLSIGMTGRRLELRGKTKEEVINFLETKITEVAPDLKERESYVLLKKSENRPSITINKISNSGSKLSPGLRYAWGGHLLGGDELLTSVKKLIQNANRQLGESKGRGILETFLIIIAGWYGDVAIAELQDKFRGLDKKDYSNIDFCYLVEPTSPPIVHKLLLSGELE